MCVRLFFVVRAQCGSILAIFGTPIPIVTNIWETMQDKPEVTINDELKFTYKVSLGTIFFVLGKPLEFITYE